MSFAPPKSKRNKSPGSPRTQEKRSGFLESPSYSIPQPRNRGNLDPELATRLEILESNLSRVSNQQDALLPLMQMLDLATTVNKTENLMKTLHKKCAETDDKIVKLEQVFKGYQSSIDASISKITSQKQQPNIDTSIIEKSMKGVVNQVNEQADSIKSLENNVINFQKTIDSRFREEFGGNQKNIENKLEKIRTEITNIVNEIKNTSSTSLKKFEENLKDMTLKSEKIGEFMAANNRQKLIDDIQDLMNTKLQEHFEFIREKYDKDIDNLCREIGIIRSEMDLINDEKRQSKMSPFLTGLPKDVEPGEKKIKINNIEQALNIHELEKFNKDNTQRIMYELHAFDDKLDNLRNMAVTLKSKSKADKSNTITNEEWNKLRDDMDLVYERYINLKYQIEGAKKKYLFDMRKIEDKMEKINQIKKEAAEEMISNPKTKRLIPQEMLVIEGFPEKIKNLMESINKNLETTFTRLEIVEEKIKENQDLIKKKTK
jgi:hypothetical protein